MKMITGRAGHYANAGDMLRLLSVRTLPADGMPVRRIDGVRVYVKPLPAGAVGKRQSLRVTAICDDCGRHVAVGRMHQHGCTENGSKSRAMRKARRESRNGYGQHVNRHPETGMYSVSDWFDGSTVATFYNGRRQQ